MGHNDVFRDSNCKVEEVGKNKKRWRKVKVRHSRERWDLMWCQDNLQLSLSCRRTTLSQLILNRGLVTVEGQQNSAVHS